LFAVSLALLAAGCAQAPVAPQLETPTPPAAAPAPGRVEPAPLREAPVVSIEIGRISLYGASFAGKKTASGENFDPGALTMAHRTLPFGTRVRVTNLENQRSVEVRVNDRGPAVPGRIADVSLAAARKLGMTEDGVIDAMLEVIRLPDE
jgi:rare lipoprotein A